MRQTAWSHLSVPARLRIVRRARQLIAERSLDLCRMIDRSPADTLVAEVLPLAEALRFLEHRAGDILAPKRPLGSSALWLRDVSLEIRREPFGVVLVIGPANYPLFLPGVQAAQALVAGNAVLIKPGRGGSRAARAFAAILADAGLPEGLCTVLDEDVDEVAGAVQAGVDKVVLTGSFETGVEVGKMLARFATPAVMELSGHDGIFILESADLDLAVRGLHFGLTLNGGNTCIAPKHIYVARSIANQLRDHLAVLYPAFPVTEFHSLDEAAEAAASTGFALGASIFGEPGEAADLASKLRAGVVVVNDVIVPTADPRLPFGGRGKSGYGTTRGGEGLLELTTIKVVVTRRGTFRPHFDRKHESDTELFSGFIAAYHGGSWRRRWEGLKQLVRAAMARQKD